MHSSNTAPEALLRLEDVKARVGLSRALIYKLASEGKFPSPIHIRGTRVSVWPSRSIDEFVAAQIEGAA